MNKQITSLCLGVALCLPFLASAGVITGSNVSVTFNPGNIVLNGTVGTGNDIVIGQFLFDINDGIDNDIFNWDSLPQAGALVGTNTFTLSGLLFDGGEELAGFNVLGTVLTGLTTSFTSNSLTINYTNVGFVGPGEVLRGQYVTRAPNGVPAPGTLALLAAALPVIAFRRRRRASR